MTAPRVVRIVVDGKPYWPIMRPGGGHLELEEIAALSTTPSEHPVVRHLRFILIDEARYPLVSWNEHALEPDERRAVVLPLDLNAGTHLQVGVLEAVTLMPPGAVPGAVGSCLVATARLFTTALADIAWGAIIAKTYTHICAELFYADDWAALLHEVGWDAFVRHVGLPDVSSQHNQVVKLLAANLTPAEGAHAPSCRILEAWEAPALVRD